MGVSECLHSTVSSHSNKETKMSAPGTEAAAGAAPAAAAGPPAAPGAPGAPPATGPDGQPTVPGHKPTMQQMAAARRLQQTQAQVDEVVGIMRVNVEKVLERDQKLSELDDRADALQQGASQFEQQAGKLKNKFWWKNMKMMIIMGVIGVIIVGIIGSKFM